MYSQRVLRDAHDGARPVDWGVGPSRRGRFAQERLTSRVCGARRTGAGPDHSGHLKNFRGSVDRVRPHAWERWRTLQDLAALIGFACRAAALLRPD
jgi:hypothetical protein